MPKKVDPATSAPKRGAAAAAPKVAVKKPPTVKAKKKGKKKVAASKPAAAPRNRVPPVSTGGAGEIDSRRFPAAERHTKDVMAGAVNAIETESGEQIEPIVMPMAEALVFNEDKLVIIIHEAAEKNAEDPVEVGVNGRRCFVKRGQKTLVPRKYVERLLRARKDNFDQDITAREERDFNRLTIRPSQVYPLSILYDPNPKGGMGWIQSITQAP